MINSRQSSAGFQAGRFRWALLLCGVLVARAEAAPPDGCELKLGAVAVAVRADAERLDITVSAGVEVLARMDVANDGALRACWALDLDADGAPELLISTESAEPALAPTLRAWKWSANAFESLGLPPLSPARPLAGPLSEDLKLVAGELVRSFRERRDGAPVAHYRYDRADRRWVALQALRPAKPGTRPDPVDALFQAPTEKP